MWKITRLVEHVRVQRRGILQRLLQTEFLFTWMRVRCRSRCATDSVKKINISFTDTKLIDDADNPRKIKDKLPYIAFHRCWTSEVKIILKIVGQDRFTFTDNTKKGVVSSRTTHALPKIGQL